TSADIGLFSNARVADITQMVNFATFTNQRFFGLNKVADLRALSQLGSGTQTGEGPNITFCSNMRIFNMAIAFDAGAVADLAVNNDAVRLNNNTITESHFAFKYTVDIDHYVATEVHIAATIKTRRIQQRSPGGHQCLSLLFLVIALQCRLLLT